MFCPKCKTGQMDIVDSRRDDKLVRRRRRCPDCGHRITTVEISKDEYKQLLEFVDLLDRVKNLVILDTSRTEKLLRQ